MCEVPVHLCTCEAPAHAPTTLPAYTPFGWLCLAAAAAVASPE